MNFEAALLWDGRESISNLIGEVSDSQKAVLLGAGTDATVNNALANFLSGVFTDQKSSDVAGELTASGATGGVDNMIALSLSAGRPCVFSDTGDLTPFVAAVADLTTCTPVVVGGVNVGGPPTFTLFDSWASLPDNPGNAGRLSVARGQAVFNEHVCVFCHAVPNLGNNPSGAAFRNI